VYVEYILENVIRHRILNSGGILAFAIAIVASWILSHQNGMDFGMLYVSAVGVATGAPLYESAWYQATFASLQLPNWKSVPYPPSSGIVTSPLAAFSMDSASTVWFLVTTAAVVAGVRSLVLLASPHSPSFVWLFASAAVLLSACMRWGIAALQSAPLVFALLAVLVFALHTHRPRLALFVVTYVTALKFTLAFPFLALLVLHKRYKLLVGSVACVAALNVLGFARVGGWKAVSQFRDGIQGHEAFGTVDSPDPWDPVSSSRLDWSYLLNGVFGYNENFKLVAIAAFGMTILWLYTRSLRLTEPISLETSAAFLAPLTCAGLLCIYHHPYDCSALYVPLIIMFAKRIQTGAFDNTFAWFLTMPLVVIMVCLPWVRALKFADAGGLPGGRGLVNMLFPIATTMLLFGTLVFVRDVTNRVPRRAITQASA
jgi:hypothetical protein